MGRAGSGGNRGGRSSGGHSGSRASGGHRVSSGPSRAGGGGNRAGAGSGGSFRGFGGSAGNGRPPGGVGMPPPPGHRGAPPPPPPRYRRTPPVYTRGTYGGGYGRRQSGAITGIILMLFIIAIMAAVMMQLYGGFTSSGGSGNIPSSTYNREKADTGVAFQNNCIIDEIGWFDNVSATERKLQDFYNETGVQPFIVFKAYDSSLTSDSEKEQYANDWYEDNIDNEGTFLFMYFAEQNTDEDVGYMCYVNGRQISSVMDAEAVEIFWAYVDEYWYSDLSTDDMVVKIYNQTAKRIMTKTTTRNDVYKYAIIVIGVAIILFGAYMFIKQKHNRDREKAEETERILNTPLEQASDELADKYQKQEDNL